MSSRLELRTTRATTATVGLVAHDADLVQMTRRAAIGLGVELDVLIAPRADDVAGDGGADHGELTALARRCDVVTFASPDCSPSQLRVLLEAGAILRPRLEAAELAADPETARRILNECGFDAAPVPASAGFRAETDAVTVSVVLARRPSGDRVTYPVVNASGRNGGAPRSNLAGLSTTERAVAAAVSIADGIDATGIISIDFLVATDGRAFVDSISLGPRSPLRPGSTSQFENHLRAILDWPLGATAIGASTS